MMGIRPGGLDHPKVVELLRLHGEEARLGLPAQYAHALDRQALAAPGVSFFAAWEGEEPIGIAALRSVGVDAGEVKSMRTAPGHQRRGVARALLRHLVATARARGYRRLYLETGTAPRYVAATALYRAAGFVETAAFGDYPASEHNLFMVLDLTAI